MTSRSPARLPVADRAPALRSPRVPGAALRVSLVAACAVLVYLPALRNGFIWDDPLVLQQLRAIHAWGDLITMPPQIPRFYYRPAIFVTYLIDRAIGGETPFWFHASVIAFHALNSLLVFGLARDLFGKNSGIPVASAILFAVAPIHVESVAWMAGRSDVIACTFLLLTVLLSVRRDATWTAWLAALAFFLALLSKETAISGLIVIPALDWLRTRRLRWSRYVPLLAVALAYFALRQHDSGAFVGGLPVARTPGAVVLDLVRAIGFYAVRGILLLPSRGYVSTVPDLAAYLVAGLLAPLGGAALLYRRWPQARWPLAFLFVWFALTLAPSLTVIARRSASAPVADRYLYVPSVASCMLLAWGIEAVARRYRLSAHWSLGIAAALAAGLGIDAAAYSRVWADNLSFWSDVVGKEPQNALAQRQLALALLDRGRLDEAERSLRAALTLPSDPPGQAMAFGNLGNIYRRQGRYADAIDAFNSGLRIAPHPVLYHGLGMTLMARAEQEQREGNAAAVQSDIQNARGALESALTFTGGTADQGFLTEWQPAKTHMLLGQVLWSLGDRSGAREHLETALRLEPAGPVADSARRSLQQIPP